MTESDGQESDEQLDDLCKQRDDMGTAARAYRAATTEAERQVFAKTLLILWHRTKRTRHVALHAHLIRDAALLGRPVAERLEADELEQFVFHQYAFREECARALFECCRLSGDLPGLQRGYQELQDVLRALAADAGVAMGADGTAPGSVTQARYEEIYAELTRNTAAASNS